MATSPNYAWAEPDNSSLVKNGAQDIRALGDAIDTSVWNVGYGQAGKNKIINGNYAINQRAFTSTTTTNTYGFDRWAGTFTDGTTTYSTQAFTVGAAPVAGYESANYARLVTTGQTLTSASSIFRQRIEDVRTFAGQTVTVSFWAQSGSGTPSIAVELIQSFGTGGSPSASVTGITATTAKQAISTTWTRYSYVISVPSISGKTLGTANDSFLQLGIWVSGGSDFNARTGSLGIQTNTFNIWGVQAEYGSYATPFQTASGGSIQGELAMCQRYYFRTTSTDTNNALSSAAGTFTTLEADAMIKFPVTMRTSPTVLDYSSVGFSLWSGGFYAMSSVTLFASGTNKDYGYLYGSITAGPAANTPGYFKTNSATGYLGFGAEL